MKPTIQESTQETRGRKKLPLNEKLVPVYAMVKQKHYEKAKAEILKIEKKYRS